jgi:hypothetical protein
MRKKLPIGIQCFQKIREANYYYVDKTGFALQLIDQGTYYFLSRPRRFGKSLFLDTLKELFEGNEPLFRGLFVHDKWDWQIKYPVIMLSFADGILKSAAELKERVIEQLRFHQQAMGVRCESASVAGIFAELIRKTHRTFGQRVVILVDEYDKPILDNIEEPDTAREMREGLRDVYSVIKGGDAHIRFTFLTGVSKFSKVSLFSGLNNLEDITINKQYSAICGYTDTDVDMVFAPELEELDRDEIRKWYNGYNWTGEAVYNPFDLLLLFRNRQFRPWWFETGTPTFLIKLLSERQAWVPELGCSHASGTLLSTFDVGNIPTETLMFQTGYLTFDTVETIGAEQFITLRYPNLEVQQSLTSSLLGAMARNPSDEVKQRQRLYTLLKSNDFGSMRELFHAFFASIPHDWYRKNQLSGYEGYYASIFYSYFAALGLDIVVEDSTNKGRIDMTVRFNGHVYLFEFKVVEMIPEGKALEQLKAKGYAEKYRSYGEPIHLIGVEFSRESRNIVVFEVEGG